jgi:hypothetical protein
LALHYAEGIAVHEEQVVNVSVALLHLEPSRTATPSLAVRFMSSRS